MKPWPQLSLRRLSLAQRFMLTAFFIMVIGALGIINWVGWQIETSAIQRNGAAASLLVDNFVAPLLQDYGQKGVLDAGYLLKLNTLLTDTSLNQWVDVFIIRDMQGEVLFSSDPSIPVTPPTLEELSAAVNGEVTSQIAMAEAENNPLLKYSDRLLKVLSPVRLYGTGKVFAVIEFYQEVDALEQEIYASKMQSWLVICAVMLGAYLLLAFFSNRFNATIEGQKEELNRQVARLSDLLEQNQKLHERVRQAAGSVATLHEQLLRRVGAELHDGPAQDLSLALLQIDTVIGLREEEEKNSPGKQSALELLAAIQSAMQNALTELRAISGGLGLPQLAGLSLAETITHAVRAHERRTRTKVSLELSGLPEQMPMPFKITIYRLAQEALNNAFHHAGGLGQQVFAQAKDGNIIIEVTDQGPGFEVGAALGLEDHFGLQGMRERVESLGGTFQVESQPGNGTKVRALLTLPGIGKVYE